MALNEGQPQANEEQQKPKQSRTVLVACICALLFLAIGVAVGIFVGPKLPTAKKATEFSGTATVEESQLDTALGTYTYKGQQIPVTVREAILESTTLEAAKNSDGTYDVPSVDTVLSIARNHILAENAKERGITATEEDAKAYAKETLGTDDYAQIGAGYGMDANQVGELMLRSALLSKLRKEVVTTQPIPEPATPTAAESGKEDEPRAEYATYILSLVGDEWDANANTWARADGPYRAQLKDYTISNEAATYSAAQAAYFVAYSQYSQVQQQVSSEWTSYVNELLADVPVELVTLVS